MLALVVLSSVADDERISGERLLTLEPMVYLIEGLGDCSDVAGRGFSENEV
jgi:hypothetical protein